MDALSRIFCKAIQSTLKQNVSTERDTIKLEEEEKLRFQQLQTTDNYCTPLINFLKDGTLPENDMDAKRIVVLSFNFVLDNDLLYFIGPPKTGRIDPRLVIPERLCNEIMEACHADLFSGHFGFMKTYSRIQNNYYWPGMYSQIKDYCQKCADCQTRKNANRATKASLVPIPVEGLPFERIAVDVLGPLPMTIDGNKYVIVFTDYLTKFAIAKAVPNFNARTTAETFINEVVLHHGAPLKLLSDRGTNFLSDLVQEICQLCDTRKVNTTPYRPLCNGLVEKYNKTLVNNLAMYVNRKGDDWDKILPYAVFAYNSSRQGSTEQTPFYLLYGRQVRLPIDAALNFTPSRYTIDIDDYATEVPKLLTAAWENARRNISRAQQHQKEYYDKNVYEPPYEIGKFVYKKTPKTNKFSHPWQGPFEIINIRYPNLEIRSVHRRRVVTEWVHMNNVKLAYFDPIVDPSEVEIFDETKISDNTASTLDTMHTDVTQNPPTSEPSTREPSSQQSLKPATSITEIKQTSEIFPKCYSLRPRDQISRPKRFRE